MSEGYVPFEKNYAKEDRKKESKQASKIDR